MVVDVVMAADAETDVVRESLEEIHVTVYSGSSF